MGKSSSALPVRRSARVNIGLPVRISGTLRDNRPYTEETQIVTLSKFGAKLKTAVPLQVGMKVKVQPRFGNNSGVFRVVWVGRAGSPRAGEVGVEFSEEVASVLGINFPDSSGPIK